jgi:type IV secretion system protein VirB4
LSQGSPIRNGDPIDPCRVESVTLLLGATGSGKSFTLSFTIQSIQKYDPLTFIFDLGGSYETLTRVFGATYLNVGLKDPGFTINPFSFELTHENLNFLYLFLRVLVEADGRYELTTADEKALFAALERVYISAEIRCARSRLPSRACRTGAFWKRRKQGYSS